MGIHFARLNIQIPEVPDFDEKISEWETVLSDAAFNGYADDFEFFYISKQRVIGISVPFEDEDPLDLIEAGSVLGYVHHAYENSEIPAGTTWKSIHDSMDDTIRTVYDPSST